MKIIAIDTSTEACSAALFDNDSVIERYQIAPRKHAELILPMLESLLQESGLVMARIDALAFGRGPGAFTGLRIAAGVTQGIAFGADLPVIPVSSPAALAQGMFRKQSAQQVLAGIDARMQEVYWGRYRLGEGDVMRLEGKEAVCLPDQVEIPTQGQWVGAGTAWQTYEAMLGARLDGRVSSWSGERYPRARDIATLAAQDFLSGTTVSAEEAVPVYLRDNVVRRPIS